MPNTCRSTRRIVAVTGAVAVIALSSCGSDDGGVSGSVPAATSGAASGPTDPPDSDPPTTDDPEADTEDSPAGTDTDTDSGPAASNTGPTTRTVEHALGTSEVPAAPRRIVVLDSLATLDRVDLRLGVGFKSLLQRATAALITLTDGTRLSARLTIAADGRASPLRDAAGIGVTTTRYGQKALAFSVTHPHPHENISTEIYNAGGAFTLVPLPDHQGGPASAVVWMNDGPRAAELLAMDTPAFEAVMTERSIGLLGHLTLASPRRMWPVITQRATSLAAQRVAITAEAAHVLPPIGAQGRNTSLNDSAALLEIATAAPGEIGTPKMLSTYEKNRALDINARAAVIDLFNRICRSDVTAIQSLRTAGLKAVYDIAPVRRAVMQAGLGP